jgi:hypothetical protein
MDPEEPPRCTSCGDAIGTYEPVVVVENGSTRITSLAREPELASSGAKLMHASCGSS